MTCNCKYFDEPHGHAGDKPDYAYFNCDEHGPQYRKYAGEIGVDARLVSKEIPPGFRLYSDILAAAPAHNTPEFIEYLKANNKVVSQNYGWLVIENCKYHREDAPWYTAFSLDEEPDFGALMPIISVLGLWEWEWLKKRESDQSVPERFHIHLHK